MFIPHLPICDTFISTVTSIYLMEKDQQKSIETSIRFKMMWQYSLGSNQTAPLSLEIASMYSIQGRNWTHSTRLRGRTSAFAAVNGWCIDNRSWVWACHGDSGQDGEDGVWELHVDWDVEKVSWRVYLGIWRSLVLGDDESLSKYDGTQKSYIQLLGISWFQLKVKDQ